MSAFPNGSWSRPSAINGRSLAAWSMVLTLLMAGSALAGSAGEGHGARLAPLDRDVKAKKLDVVVRTADADTADAQAAKPAPHARAVAPAAVLSPPANDECSGAIPIPGGPFPVASAPVDITEATPIGSDDPDVCTTAGVDQTVWFSFTPSASGLYVFSTCAGFGASTTVYDTVLAVFDGCPGVGNELVCNDGDPACTADLPGAPYVDQSTLSQVLVGGTTYYIAVGHWSGDVGGVVLGLNEVAVVVDRSPAPSNDTCTDPAPLALDRITFGTTSAANDDYRSPDSCFTGPGQLSTSSPGADVVYSFVPPVDGKYSFRYVQDDTAAPLRSQSPSLYLANNCPDPDPANAITGCIKAANRMNDQTTGNGNRSEEVDCVTLTGGTTYYLFFDDRNALNPGGDFALEVTHCSEESEPNDSIPTATAYVPNSGCFMEGSAVPSGPTADVDFYDLGSPTSGSKIFAAVDAAASGSSDFQLRITTATDTLGFDDNDGTSWIGSNAPVVAGPFADGTETYLRVNGVPLTAGNGPYRLYARIESGAAQNESLPDPPSLDNPSNGTFYGATHITGGGFIKGTIYAWDTVTGDMDLDCYRFVAREGDNIVVFSDNNPARTSGTITNVWPLLRTLDLEPPAWELYVGQTLRNNVTPSPGTLVGTTPSVTSEFWHYRARYTGAYGVCYRPTREASTEAPPPAAYPLPYQGSVSINCGPVPPPGTTDVSIVMTGPSSPTLTGSLVDFTITLTNEGTEIAQDVRVLDGLPNELAFVGLNVDDGFGGGNTGCLSLPTPGTNDAPVDCTNYALAPGASITYTLSVQVNNCIGAELSVVNVASLFTYTTDPNPANDDARVTVTTSEDGTCTDLLCDLYGCIPDGCTVNDHCDGTGACVGDALNCDDGSVCTEDWCDPLAGCVNDASQTGDLCNDGNECTLDQCDPIDFCVFPPVASGTPCDDFLNCTTNDVCDGQGACFGRSVCDDGLPCTDDYADENNACACDNPVSFPGTLCDDGNACTTGTTCDGVGGSVDHCTGGGATDCDDANPCTNDSCDPVSGCVHVPAPGPCDDNDACTTGDACSGGSCVGTAVDCNDDNPCTNDACNPASGCVSAPNTGPCSDDDACTSGDTCGGGVCHPGTPIVCNDDNPCTNDTCSPASGCVYANNTSPCDDGNVCTVDDTCSGGACVGDPNLCSDNNSCTIDSCSTATGCAHVPNPGGACEDGDLCTVGDQCDTTGLLCLAGDPPHCDDGLACTADLCVPATGCFGAPANFDARGFSATRIDGRDLAVFAKAYESRATDPAPSRYDDLVDFDANGYIGDIDFHLFMTTFGHGCL